MKKTILILTFLVFAAFGQSCSDEDHLEKVEKHSINPPAWIQGVWLLEVDGVKTSIGFIFKKDDFISKVTMQEVSYKELIKQSQSINQKVKVSETITNTSYLLRVTMGVSTLEHHFEKVGENKIEWKNTTNPVGTYIYVKQ